MRDAFWLYIGLFVSICLASLWILHSALLPGSDGEHGITSYLTHAVFTEFDTEGHIKTRISAARVTHFAKNQHTYFETPVILFYPPDDKRNPWKISAAEGQSDPTGETIWLSGNVLVHHAKSTTHPETTLSTNTMTLFPKKSMVSSAEETTITRPNIQVHGKGLQANLKTGEYVLLSHTRAAYQPSSKVTP